MDHAMLTDLARIGQLTFLETYVYSTNDDSRRVRVVWRRNAVAVVGVAAG